MQKGNSTLELVLFLPLALFFLFVVTDAGLSLTQRAAIVDAFRASIQSLPAYAKNNKDYQELSKNIAEELNLNMNKVFSSYSEGQYLVVTRLYRLDFNALTGEKVSAYPVLIREDRFGQIGNDSLLSSPRSVDSFISAEFQEDSFGGKYAQPLGVVNNIADSNRSGLRYAENSWLIYSEVRAIPAGINSNFLKSTLGGLYSIQLQQLEKIRDY